MTPPVQFTKSFTQQEALSDACIAQAVAVMQSGRLHRYNTLGDELSEAACLEQEYAHYQGTDYCLACASGGYALHIALKAAGLQAGEPVLTNAFTLAPVPGAIHNAGGKVELVEIDENYCVDLSHLSQQIIATGARFFMLSHMRGHLADMHQVAKICQAHDVILIEDCAHTMGAWWDNTRSGNFGQIACFSTQTYKHINSGEGGLLTTNDPNIMASAIIHSGSYMLYNRHGTPPPAGIVDNLKLTTPNYSGRMDNLRAAILRPQLQTLEQNIERWNLRYRALESALRACSAIQVPHRPAQEKFVGSSIQFRVPQLSEHTIPELIRACLARGVELKWFGDAQPNGFTSRYDSWQYLGDMPKLSKTLNILATTLDMRIPLTFTLEDMSLLGMIVREEVDHLLENTTITQ